MAKFELTEYTNQIASMAKVYGIGAPDAVDHFIVNLSTMSDHFSGASELNFRELGQKWNALGYKVRNQQRLNAIASVSKKIEMPKATRNRREL